MSENQASTEAIATLIETQQKLASRFGEKPAAELTVNALAKGFNTSAEESKLPPSSSSHK